MKITSRKGISKRTWFIIIAVLVLVIIGGAAYAWYNRSKPAESTSTVNTNPPTQEEKDAGNAAKKDTVNAPSTQPTTPPTSSGKTNVAVTITAATQADTTVQIRGLVSTVVDTTGTCTLTLTKGSSTVTKTAGTQALANSTTCQGFNISTSELSAGDWQIILKYESNTLTGEATGTVTVR